MEDTITFIATQDGGAFTETIKLLDVLVVADVLLAELRMDDIFVPVEVQVDFRLIATQSVDDLPIVRCSFDGQAYEFVRKCVTKLP